MVYTFADGTPVEKRAKSAAGKKDSAKTAANKCHHCKKPGHNKAACRSFIAGKPANK
jgi:hypothetical protein